MNPISKRLLKDAEWLAQEACRHFGSELEYEIGGDSLIAKNDAIAIERLVEAAEHAMDELRQVCGTQCMYSSASEELEVALKPFREER